MSGLIEAGLTYGRQIEVEMDRVERFSDNEGNDFYILPKITHRELDCEKSEVYSIFEISHSFGVGRELLGDKKKEVLDLYGLDIAERILKPSRRKNETRISKKN